MALAKVTVVDKIEIAEDGSVFVRRATYVTEDGVRITEPTYHRTSYVPGDPVEHEDARVRDVAGLIWTPAVIQAHRNRPKPPGGGQGGGPP